MEFDSANLLSNLAFAATVSKVSFANYLKIMNLAKGCVPRALTEESVKELEKFNMRIDNHKKYITNIFDYRMHVKDNDPTVVYVFSSESRELIGTIDFNTTTDGHLNCTAFLCSSMSPNDLITTTE